MPENKESCYKDELRNSIVFEQKASPGRDGKGFSYFRNCSFIQ